MIIKTTTSHNITFAVKAFWDEAGGMGENSYGNPDKDLPEAIRLLELAKVASPEDPWVIVCEVTTTTA